MGYENILVHVDGRIGVVTLNRPKALNALNSALIAELNRALDGFETDDGISTIILTGSDRAFAAGADIKEMQGLSFPGTYTGDFITSWERLSRFRKPVIAAVAGYALGGGCELAMMCDILLAADNARFGQPEIQLGIIPGAGGSQRLTRAVGKAKSMEMCLTGRTLSASEADMYGLVSRVVPLADLMTEAMKVADTIANLSLPSVMMAKESVNRSFETTLGEGIRFERRLFQSLFASDDQKEGMAAFVEKRSPNFNNR
ncbi:enoyl-CoA hydratase [Ancylobacter defluvii]|uniref:enoyl-CoA hydratase n=1 Tax=Ancylobacter defluvii TaxID=1282440 RepID=A0A9W6JZM1_9HYPH|nr:enoyl-CoA hydratase [Ancylobacter defluvii]MBS7589410.1 enoyl-CoA hydratase [Ancylobacter defluvii]GLK85025.1 enoyl-CoA hydratase [Ancylobacter defluvii]